eukprot:5953493-Amphidinium_carterae.1
MHAMSSLLGKIKNPELYVDTRLGSSQHVDIYTCAVSHAARTWPRPRQLQSPVVGWSMLQPLTLAGHHMCRLGSKRCLRSVTTVMTKSKTCLICFTEI